MGHLPNKLRKERRDHALREMQAADRAIAAPPAFVCGGCGRDHFQTTIWQATWSDVRPQVFLCRDCVTPDQADFADGVSEDTVRGMCNLYSMTKSQQAIRDLVNAMRDLTGNLPPLPPICAALPPA